jgi:DNA-binding IclR family transcriptional regulator
MIVQQWDFASILSAVRANELIVVVVTVTSPRTNTNVLRIGARLPLKGSLALGAQHGKLDANLRTSALLGTPLV